MKSIILCADDYSFSLGISEAIIHLLDKNRLSATSCMVNTPDWSDHAAALKPFINTVDVGLHFTLTEVPPSTLPPYTVASIIKKTYFRAVNQTDIEKELQYQIEHFEKTIGQLPDFIDGHQHVHQLPIIREALVSVYKKIFPDHSCYIRVPISKPRTLKSSAITLLGALALKKQLIQHEIPYNQSFSGVYNFSIKKNYSDYFCQFLKNIKSGGIVMCHPSVMTYNHKDRVALAREQEFRYFNSPKFLDDCQRYAVTIQKKCASLKEEMRISY